MKIFLFRRIERLTENFHPEGGLVIVASDVEHARAMTAEMEYAELTEEEWAEVIVYELAGVYPSKAYVFPDTGCC